jgi:hypothetical protein
MHLLPESRELTVQGFDPLDDLGRRRLPRQHGSIKHRFLHQERCLQRGALDAEVMDNQCFTVDQDVLESISPPMPSLPIIHSTHVDLTPVVDDEESAAIGLQIVADNNA